MTEKHNITLHSELNAPGRKGAISKIAKRVGVHRNTVRRILQGNPGRGLNAAAVIRTAQEVLAEIEQEEQEIIEALDRKIEIQRKKIDSLRRPSAA